MTPFRELYWNIPHHALIYPLFLPALVLFLYGGYRLVLAVRVGKPEPMTRPLGRMARDVAWQAIVHARLFAEPAAGVLHAAMAWGFGILFVATCLVGLQDYVGIPTLRGPFYLIFMSLTVDLFGVAAVVGVIV